MDGRADLFAPTVGRPRSLPHVKVCQEEGGVARIRERKEGGVLVPLCLTTANVPEDIQCCTTSIVGGRSRTGYEAATLRILA